MVIEILQNREQSENGGKKVWCILSGIPKKALSKKGILNAFSSVLYMFMSFTCNTSLSANDNACDWFSALGSPNGHHKNYTNYSRFSHYTLSHASSRFHALQLPITKLHGRQMKYLCKNAMLGSNGPAGMRIIPLCLSSLQLNTKSKPFVIPNKLSCLIKEKLDEDEDEDTDNK
jgi:hypothetical protein